MLQRHVRIRDSPPHVSRRTIVGPETFFRLFEVASHDVHKSVDVDFLPLLERVQVGDRYPAWKIVPFVGSDNLIVRLQMWSRFKVVSEPAAIPSAAQVPRLQAMLSDERTL